MRAAIQHRLHNPFDYCRRLRMQQILAAGFLFLYFPILALIAFSFNDSKRNVAWRGFTFKYYQKAFNNEALHDAFINSLIVAEIGRAS